MIGGSHQKEQPSSDEKGLSDSDDDDMSPLRIEPIFPVEGDDDEDIIVRRGYPNDDGESYGFGDDDGDEALPYGSPLANVQPGRLHYEYSAMNEVGSGDFGTVVSAVYDEDGRTYAIKTAKKAAVGERDLQSHLQEVYALSACNSPYVLRYYDAWVEGGVVSIKTEYVSGGSTKQLPTPWGELQLWDLLLQTSLGLHSMHHANIAHLDIKPHNIFVEKLHNEDGSCRFEYKIGDFGLARPVKDTSPIGERFTGINDDEGDCRYLCPYLLAHGVTQWITQADIYSLGASVVELAGGDPVMVRRAGTTTFAMQYSATLGDLLSRMMATEPQSRPTAFDVIRTAARVLSETASFPQLCDVSVGNAVRGYQAELDALEQEYLQLQQLAAAHGLSPQVENN